jgi:hypothetical protein
MLGLSPVTPLECTTVPLRIVSPLTFLADMNISFALSDISAIIACDEDIAKDALLNVCVSVPPPLVLSVRVFVPSEAEVIRDPV